MADKKKNSKKTTKRKTKRPVAKLDPQYVQGYRGQDLRVQREDRLRLLQTILLLKNLKTSGQPDVQPFYGRQDNPTPSIPPTAPERRGNSAREVVNVIGPTVPGGRRARSSRISNVVSEPEDPNDVNFDGVVTFEERMRRLMAEQGVTDLTGRRQIATEAAREGAVRNALQAAKEADMNMAANIPNLLAQDYTTLSDVEYGQIDPVAEQADFNVPSNIPNLLTGQTDINNQSDIIDLTGADYGQIEDARPPTPPIEDEFQDAVEGEIDDDDAFEDAVEGEPDYAYYAEGDDPTAVPDLTGAEYGPSVTEPDYAYYAEGDDPTAVPDLTGAEYGPSVTEPEYAYYAEGDDPTAVPDLTGVEYGEIDDDDEFQDAVEGGDDDDDAFYDAVQGRPVRRRPTSPRRAPPLDEYVREPDEPSEKRQKEKIGYPYPVFPFKSYPRYRPKLRPENQVLEDKDEFVIPTSINYPKVDDVRAGAPTVFRDFHLDVKDAPPVEIRGDQYYFPFSDPSRNNYPKEEGDVRAGAPTVFRDFHLDVKDAPPVGIFGDQYYFPPDDPSTYNYPKEEGELKEATVPVERRRAPRGDVYVSDLFQEGEKRGEKLPRTEVPEEVMAGQLVPVERRPTSPRRAPPRDVYFSDLFQEGEKRGEKLPRTEAPEEVMAEQLGLPVQRRRAPRTEVPEEVMAEVFNETKEEDLIDEIRQMQGRADAL